MTNRRETGETPQSVAIVAMGPSNQSFVADRSKKVDMLDIDEVWLVNSAVNTFQGDKVFIMDDLRRCAKRYPKWGPMLKETKMEIVTCRTYKEYPTSVKYPLEDVVKCVKDDFFSGTVAYMIGLAILYEVEHLYLYGCDFWYPNSLSREPGADCVSYLLGIAKERGVRFKIPQTSTLLNANMASEKKIEGEDRIARALYGYDYNPGDSIKRVNNGKGTQLDHLAANMAPFAVQTAIAKDGELNLNVGKKSNGKTRPEQHP